MFGRKLTPLKYSEVVGALKQLGFEMKPKGSTAHEKWVKVTETGKKVVTVDKHVAPFAGDLIKYMANQAGISHKKFHALCKGDCTVQDIYPQTT